MSRRGTNSRGIHLLEVTIGIAIGAGALVALITLAQSNTRTARMNEERSVARGALVELTDILMGERLDLLRALAGERTMVLNDILDRRIRGLPTEARDQRLQQVAPLKGRLSLALEERVGGRTDLVRMTLSAELDGTTIRVSRFFRDGARPFAPAIS